MLLITKTEMANTGHFEAGASICYKKNMYIVIIYESEIEFFIAANTAFKRVHYFLFADYFLKGLKKFRRYHI